ncbi:MAG: restriction endonuclease subunit S [Synergistaceae bacterium]|nr:restriction endonuclease subunit S [Synergistaceae bacterium]
MRSYDGYKESNIAWLGEIPAHWDITRGKNLYRKMNRPVNDGDEVITCFRNGEVTLRKNRRTTGFTESLKEIGYQGIKKGDIVIHVMDAFAGAIGVSDSDGKGTPVYSVCQAKGEANNYYYAYVLREMARTGYIQSLYRGIRERSSDFRFEVFANQYYPVPPLSEQERIAKFLDYKISRIEKLISIRKRQIIDLEDLKKALINRAVTQGGWKVVKLKRVVTVRSDKGEYKSQTADKYIGLENIKGYSEKLVETGTQYDTSIQSRCCKGDLLFGKLRPYLAKVVIAPYDAFCTSELLVISSFAGDMRYLRYVMLNPKFINDVDSSTYGAKMPRANSAFILNSLIPLPPLTEQIRISEYLDKKCSLIDRALINFSKQIEALNELKARLISDCVTGRINILGQEN